MDDIPVSKKVYKMKESHVNVKNVTKMLLDYDIKVTYYSIVGQID
jgi:hypothetical protein